MDNGDWGPSEGELACLRLLAETRELLRKVVSGDPDATEAAAKELRLLDTYKPGMMLRAIVPGGIGGHRKEVTYVHGRLRALSILPDAEGNHRDDLLSDWINSTGNGVEPTPPEGTCSHCGGPTWHHAHTSPDYQICAKCHMVTAQEDLPYSASLYKVEGAFCPKCKEGLKEHRLEDKVTQRICPACGWKEPFAWVWSNPLVFKVPKEG